RKDAGTGGFADAGLAVERVGDRRLGDAQPAGQVADGHLAGGRGVHGTHPCGWAATRRSTDAGARTWSTTMRPAPSTPAWSAAMDWTMRRRAVASGSERW